MSESDPQRGRVEVLEEEIRALQETKTALVARVERSMDEVGSAFHLFETNILLRRRVEERTAALSHANEELRKEIEERKRIQAQVLRAKESAEAASRAKSEFLAHMSHELRTPLNGVLGMASLLVQLDLGSEELEAARTIQQSAESLLSRINDILDLSKAEAGKMDVESEPFDLQDLLQECLQTVSWRARERDLDLALETATGTPRDVHGDPGRLRQVLLNLLSNATKFTERGRVVLRAAPEGPGAVRFEVQDTGIGIAPEKLERIFEPFTQADTSTTRRYGGTGLGLTISRRLVELMGGILEVHSEVGVGSSFAFSLPRLATGSRTEGRARVQVLVVDDDPVNRQVALRMLERLGCRADVESDARRTLDRLSEESYDALLLDCHMPFMDGIEVTTRLREDPNRNDLRVIGVSADDAETHRGACRRAGMDDVLSKPLRLEALARALSRWWPATAT